MSIGLIGLGTLGRTVAARIVAANRPLIVWNRTEERAEGLAAAIAASPGDLVSEVSTVILCLRDSDAVDAVLHARDGVFSAPVRGRLIIDLTTHHPDRVTGFHREFDDRGAMYLEAPALGHVQAAAQGTLGILASGRREAFDRALPLLELIGRDIYYCGEPGEASRIKLINEMVLASFLATVAEAVTIGEHCGVRRERMLQILSGAAGNSAVLALKREKLAHDDYAPQLTAATLCESLAALESIAGRPLVMGAPACDLFRRVVARGQGELDCAVVYEALAQD